MTWNQIIKKKNIFGFDEMIAIIVLNHVQGIARTVHIH